MKIDRLIELSCNSQPVESETIMSVENSWKRIPSQLYELYVQTDGFITPGGYTVYDIGSLQERNDTYEVEMYSSGYTLMGDNSGGRGYLLSGDGVDNAVYSSDLGGLSPKYFEKESATLEEWISGLK